MRQAVALFGEAEKGDFRTAHYCRDLDELERLLGHPPPESRGLYFAIQALLFNRLLIYFRVPEEGFCRDEYRLGLQMLRDHEGDPRLAAIGLPGVGDSEIIAASRPLCERHNSLLLFTESDLYDFLTS